MELTNQDAKVVGKLLDPIVEQTGDKSTYNNKTLASIYYNEKKMVEVFKNFTKMYDKEFNIPSMSNIINWLDWKEEIYGNLYVDGSVVRIEFIIK